MTALALVAAVALSACDPNPPVTAFEVPGAEWASPRSLNSVGTAVGIYSASDGGHGFVADLRTGVTKPLPDPPTSPSYPGGVELRQAIDIDDAGVVLAIVTGVDGAGTGWRLWTYDPADGSWIPTGCPVSGLGNRGLIANGGLVVCGDRILDTVTGTDLEVASPDGCDGMPARVNAHRIVVGWCRSGGMPLFATDLDSGHTVGFGAGLEVTGGVAADSFGSFTDSGYQVLLDQYSTTPHSWVYRIPADLAGDAPTLVDLGAFADLPMVAMAISEHGILATNVRVGDKWVLGTIDVERRSLKAWNTSGLPARPSSEVATVVGVNDAGEAIGFRVDPAEGIPYTAFAVTPGG